MNTIEVRDDVFLVLLSIVNDGYTHIWENDMNCYS